MLVYGKKSQISKFKDALKVNLLTIQLPELQWCATISRNIECIYSYLQTENARAVPTTAVLRRMRLFVVRAAVEITICDITKHRIRHFITSLLIVSSAYYLQFFFQDKNYIIKVLDHIHIRMEIETSGTLPYCSYWQHELYWACLQIRSDLTLPNVKYKKV